MKFKCKKTKHVARIRSPVAPASFIHNINSLNRLYVRDNSKKICLCNQYLLTMKKLVINFQWKVVAVEEDKRLRGEILY